ncbi:MAG: hypothetical protein NTZ65_01680 [Candidatus Berkelbacteria bacterium]|nr:hypothetical protein [Candidatus Berkelbacteria bacterium]
MKENIKHNRMAQYLRHCIDLYLSENSEFVGFSYVLTIDLSEDQKNANVFIALDEKQNIAIVQKKILSDKKRIVEISDKYFSSRNFPKINYKFLKNDEFDF